MAMAECARCGRKFTCVSNFDAHQKWVYNRNRSEYQGIAILVCVSPPTLGMEQNKYGRWYFPQVHDTPKLELWYPHGS